MQVTSCASFTDVTVSCNTLLVRPGRFEPPTAHEKLVARGLAPVDMQVSSTVAPSLIGLSLPEMTTSLGAPIHWMMANEDIISFTLNKLAP